MPNNDNDLDTPIGKEAFLRNLKLLSVNSNDSVMLNNIVDPSEQAADYLADIIKHSSGDNEVNSIIDDDDDGDDN